MKGGDVGNAYIAEVLNRETKKSSGMGVLLDQATVITCAHVVNEAMGRSTDCSVEPNEGERFDIRFPFISDLRKAAIRQWHPASDICVLRLAAPVIVDTDVVMFSSAQSGEEFRACHRTGSGSPLEWAYGQTTHASDGGYYQVASLPSQPFLRPGSSGGPAISKNTGRVLGIVVRVNTDQSVGHIVSAQSIALYVDEVRKKLVDHATGPTGPTSAAKEGGGKLSFSRTRVWQALMSFAIVFLAAAIFVLNHISSMKLHKLQCGLEYQPKIAESKLTLLLHEKQKADYTARENSVHRVRVMLAQLNRKVVLKADEKFDEIYNEVETILGSLTSEITNAGKQTEIAKQDLSTNERNLRACEISP